MPSILNTEATHVEGVPVKEIFKGEAVWEGFLRFSICMIIRRLLGCMHGHTKRMILTPIRHVSVLYLHPVKSAQDAVRVSIAQEIRGLGGAEES